MGKRKTAQSLALGGASRAKVARRKQETAGEYALGLPLMPQGHEKNWRRTFGIVSAELLAARKLALSDANLLAALVDALRGSRIGTTEERAAAHAEALRIRAEFDARTAFPEPVVEVPVERPVGIPSLDEFIAQVESERGSFAARMVPGETVALDNNGKPYAWTTGDAAQVAREYAQQVTQGSIVAGELVTFAAARFLKELEMGHERGLFFDPAAARNIMQWLNVFGSWQAQPWQVFCAVNVMSWKRPSGLRRFSRFWLSVGRKNGKSSFLAAFGLFCMIADGEPRADIFSVATKRDQARLIWADAEFTVKHNLELSNHVKAQRFSLAVEKTGSSFGSDAHTLDGLRPACSLIDEIHEHPSDAVVKRLQSGTLSRPQPLLLFATTAGEDRDSWCYSQHEIFERILRGTTEEFAFSDSWFLYIAQMDKDDSPEDEANWVKSNPSIGVTLSLDSLRIEAAALKTDPASIFSFQRFHCNIWQSVVAGHSLPQDKINACVGSALPPGGPMELRKTFLAKAKEERTMFFGGFDLGLSDDLAAFTLVTPNFLAGLTNTGAYHFKTAVVPFFWIPAQRIREHETNWRIPLALWIREGWIKVAGEELVDLDIVSKDIKDICSTYKVPVMAYDKWKSETMFARLHDERVAHCVAVPQLPSFLTSPSREFKMGILNGTVIHLGNPVFKWMCSNVDLEPNEKTGGIKPAKSGGDRRNKIDGVQAAITAMQQLLDPENKRYFTTPSIRFI